MLGLKVTKNCGSGYLQARVDQFCLHFGVPKSNFHSVFLTCKKLNL
jgi:hypothetical protein